jgi:hypothetical protein
MFTYTWTPDIPGNYTVIATFSGSAGYYGSTAETSFYASPAATPAPTAACQANLATTADLMIYVVVGVIAIIIAIAIVGVFIMQSLRKRL